MKITKTQLQQLIKEELAGVMREDETDPKSPTNDPEPSGVVNIDGILHYKHPKSGEWVPAPEGFWDKPIGKAVVRMTPEPARRGLRGYGNWLHQKLDEEK